MDRTVYYLLVIAVVIMCITIIYLEKKEQLITRFNFFLLSNSGITHNVTFKNFAVNHSPKYFETIREHFTNNEIKKLNKWRIINDKDYNLIQKLV